MQERQKGKYEKTTGKTSRFPGSLTSRLILLLAASLLVCVGIVAAKYIQNASGDSVFHAPEFYFYSNRLSATPKSYTLNSDVTSVSFILTNYADDLRFSELDIEYSIQVTDDDGNDSQSAVLIVTGDSTLTGKVKSLVTVDLTNLKPGVTYTVTATGTAGYTQTLTANFTVSDKDENVYKHLDTTHDEYIVLTVWTHNVTGPLTIDFPAGLIPDNTNPGMEGVQNFKEGAYKADKFTVVGFPKYSSQTYRFFRTGGAYTVEQFDVYIGEKTYEAVSSDLP